MNVTGIHVLLMHFTCQIHKQLSAHKLKLTAYLEPYLVAHAST